MPIFSPTLYLINAFPSRFFRNVKVFNFLTSNLSDFPFIGQTSGVKFENSLPGPRPWNIFSCFFFYNFYSFTLYFYIHDPFWINFVYCVRLRSRFILCLYISRFSITIVEKLSFLLELFLSLNGKLEWCSNGCEEIFLKITSLWKRKPRLSWYMIKTWDVS